MSEHPGAPLFAALLALTLAALPTASPALAVDELGSLLERLDVDAIGGAGQWRAVVGGRAVMVLVDPASGRLRIQAHVTAAEALDEALLRRLLEANFDATGEARYALGGTTLWSLYVAPLAALDRARFAAALAAVVNLAASFGSGYGSGIAADGSADASPRGALVRELVARANRADAALNGEAAP